MGVPKVIEKEAKRMPEEIIAEKSHKLKKHESIHPWSSTNSKYGKLKVTHTKTQWSCSKTDKERILKATSNKDLSQRKASQD